MDMSLNIIVTDYGRIVIVPQDHGAEMEFKDD
jgi:hypothetical protein